MGNIGFQEMVGIFIIALLVFGPKRLPELGRSLGKGLAEFKKATGGLKESIDREIRIAEAEANSAVYPSDNTETGKHPDAPKS